MTLLSLKYEEYDKEIEATLLLRFASKVFNFLLISFNSGEALSLTVNEGVITLLISLSKEDRSDISDKYSLISG